jgi:hypothetical protein
MKYLIRFLHAVLDITERLKGERYFQLGSVHQSFDDGYSIFTNEGFEINIHCYEYVYECIYLNGWYKNKKISIYHIYCVCSPNTPQEIQDRLKGDLKIPSFLHPWSSKESHKKQAIKAYIDMKLKKEI